MAKNKNNRDRKQPRSERSAPQAAESAVLDREEQHSPQLTTPGDAASRKRQKGLGHN